MANDDVRTAYFTLLRAREELDGLRRYRDYLDEEARRLRRFVQEGTALADTVDQRLRRAMRHTDGPLDQAINDRLAFIADERGRLPDRELAAEAFVDECEQVHAQLQRQQ